MTGLALPGGGLCPTQSRLLLKNFRVVRPNWGKGFPHRFRIRPSDETGADIEARNQLPTRVS